MKKTKVIIGLVIVLVFIAYFVLANVVLWPGVYLNNSELTREENREIKELVLEAVKDRCSALYEIEPSEIYDTTKSDLEIVQLDEPADIEKTWICLLNPNFMSTATKTGENEYQVMVTIYYPEEQDYYHFDVQRDADNNYIITWFGIDT